MHISHHHHHRVYPWTVVVQDNLHRQEKNYFYREQVQKELKLPRLIINSISIFTATYLLLISSPLKSQNIPSETEQVDPTTSEQEKITPIQKDSTKTNKQPNTKSCNNKHQEYKRRKKIYFNRNFPFIHYGYNYLLGFRSPSIDWIKK